MKLPLKAIYRTKFDLVSNTCEKTIVNYILNKPENLNQAWLDMTRPEKPEELNKN
jgi:hypothetical protein